MRVVVLTPVGEGQLGMSFADALERDGHDVTPVEAEPLLSGRRDLIVARRVRLDGVISRGRARAIERTALEVDPDLTIVVKGRFLRAAHVRRLRQATGAPVVNYYPDDPFHPVFYEPAMIGALRAYNTVAIWSRALVERLLAADVRGATYLPFGYDDAIYRPGGEEPAWDVAFVGQWSAIREQHLHALEGLDVVVTGSEWDRAARRSNGLRALPGRHFGRHAAAVYRRARVGLNILHPQNAGAHNMRTWELPATGTASAMTRTAYHDALFGAGGYAGFGDPDELRGVVESLLDDAPRREHIAAAGRAAVEHGTYRARMRELVALANGRAGESAA